MKNDIVFLKMSYHEVERVKINKSDMVDSH